MGRDQLAEMWDHILEEIVGSLATQGIRWSNIDVVTFGLDGSWAPIILWVGVPSGILSSSGIQIAQICKTTLRKNAVNDVDCEIGEVNRFHFIGPRTGELWPVSRDLFGTADIEEFSTAMFGKSKFSKYPSYPRHPKGFYATPNEKIFALTSRYFYSAMEAENERSRVSEELWSQQRHLVVLPENSILQPLRKVAQPRYYNSTFAGSSDETDIKVFEGQDQNFEDEGLTPNLSKLRFEENKFVRFEKLIKMLNAWSTPESRIVGSPESLPRPKLQRGDYMVEWRLEEVGPSGINKLPTWLIFLVSRY